MNAQTPSPGNDTGLPKYPRVARHQRANYERTDALLCIVKGLIAAFTILHDEYPEPDSKNSASLAKSVVLDLLNDHAHELDRVRSMEWVGIGGSIIGAGLAEDDIAIASGQPGQG